MISSGDLGGDPDRSVPETAAIGGSVRCAIYWHNRSGALGGDRASALRNQLRTSNVYLMMKRFVAALFCALLVGCAPAPSPSISPQPSVAPVPSASSSGSPAPSRSLEPSPSSAPSDTATPLAIGTPEPGDMAAAAELVNFYVTDLVQSKWSAAWALLGPDRKPTLPAFTYERSAYFASVKGRFTAKRATHDAATMAFWLPDPSEAASANPARAFIVEVDYPALAGNNAGYEIYLAAPDGGGTWHIWALR